MKLLNRNRFILTTPAILAVIAGYLSVSCPIAAILTIITTTFIIRYISNRVKITIKNTSLNKKKLGFNANIFKF
jgi:hypothetical protein